MNRITLEKVKQKAPMTVNTTLTTVVLSLVGWVANDINTMKESLQVELVQRSMVQVDVAHLHDTIEKHNQDCEERFRKLGISRQP